MDEQAIERALDWMMENTSKLVSNGNESDWSVVPEVEDNTTRSQERACTAVACEI